MSFPKFMFSAAVLVSLASTQPALALNDYGPWVVGEVTDTAIFMEGSNIEHELIGKNGDKRDVFIYEKGQQGGIPTWTVHPSEVKKYVKKGDQIYGTGVGNGIVSIMIK